MGLNRLAGQVAWISGGTKGIGEGAAKLLADEGASVVILGRGVQDGLRVEKQIRDAGGKALFIQCDVKSSAEIEASIAKTVETFGGLNILVNNAGTCEVKMLHEVEESEWDSLMDLNVKSMYLAFKFAFEHLVKNPRSYVVNVGSISSFVGQEKTPVYTTSKGAVMQLSRSIGLDYAKYGIRCNCVCPGITDTPLLRYHMSEFSDPDERIKQRVRRVPMNVALTIEQVARSILYFSCEDSAGVTATTLVVDGGYIACAEWDAQNV